MRLPGASASLASFSFLGNPHVGLATLRFPRSSGLARNADPSRAPACELPTQDTSVSMDVASFLSSIDAFKSLSPQMASSLAERVSVASFPRGTTIIRQGDPADCMYVIARGSVEVPV